MCRAEVLELTTMISNDEKAEYIVTHLQECIQYINATFATYDERREEIQSLYGGIPEIANAMISLISMY